MEMSARRKHQFEAAYRNLYHRADREVGYRSRHFLKLGWVHGPEEAARRLLRPWRSGYVAEGFARLAIVNRLDLSIEHLVTQPEWARYFPEEQAEARRRLASVGFRLPVAA